MDFLFPDYVAKLHFKDGRSQQYGKQVTDTMGQAKEIF